MAGSAAVVFIAAHFCAHFVSSKACILNCSQALRVEAYARPLALLCTGQGALVHIIHARADNNQGQDHDRLENRH